jgi:hypothetical protein
LLDGAFGLIGNTRSRQMTKYIEKDPVHVVEDDDIRPPPPYEEEGPPQVVTADTVRQAPRGTPVLWVLIAGLAAIGIAWVIIDKVIY